MTTNTSRAVRALCHYLKNQEARYHELARWQDADGDICPDLHPSPKTKYPDVSQEPRDDRAIDQIATRYGLTGDQLVEAYWNNVQVEVGHIIDHSKRGART